MPTLLGPITSDHTRKTEAQSNPRVRSVLREASFSPAGSLVLGAELAYHWIPRSVMTTTQGQWRWSADRTASDKSFTSEKGAYWAKGRLQKPGHSHFENDDDFL